MTIVAEVMKSNASACAPDDTLECAARIMWERDCGSVPVVNDEHQVVGMITDRDICMAAYLRGVRLQECRIGDVMAQSPVACRPGDPIEKAETAMRMHRVRRLPVIDENGQLTGILSVNDLVLASPTTGQKKDRRSDAVLSTVAAICEHRQFPQGGAEAGQ